MPAEGPVVALVMVPAHWDGLVHCMVMDQRLAVVDYFAHVVLVWH